MIDIQAALFDIDGTLTRGDEMWAASLIKSPDVSRLRKAWLYAGALPHHLLSRAEIVSQADFRDRWVRLLAWLMTGWSAAQVQAHYDRIMLETLIPTLRADVVEILKQYKAQGHCVVLVSTMFSGVVEGVAAALGADAGLGSRVEMKDGRCTGRIVGQPCSGVRKIDFSREYLAQHLPGISLAACAAYADSRSDIPFLNGVGHPVAVYPDDAMRAAAQQHGWDIFSGN